MKKLTLDEIHELCQDLDLTCLSESVPFNELKERLQGNDKNPGLLSNLAQEVGAENVRPALEIFMNNLPEIAKNRIRTAMGEQTLNPVENSSSSSIPLPDAEKLRQAHNDKVLGISFMKQRKFYRAEQYFREAIDIDPNNSEILYHLAVCLLEQVKEERTTPSLKDGFNPDKVATSAVETIEKEKEAKEYLGYAFIIDPHNTTVNNVSALYGLANLFEDLGDLENAKRMFHLITVNPNKKNNPEDVSITMRAFVFLGKISMNEENYKESEKYFRQAHELDQSTPKEQATILFLIVSALWHQNDFNKTDEIELHCKRILEDCDDLSIQQATFKILGDVYMFRDRKKTQEYLRQALQIDSQDKTTIEMLKAIQSPLYRLEQALFWISFLLKSLAFK